MIGCREIERLRRELTPRDGSAFDLRGFHDQVLAHGSLPLATLAARAARTGSRTPASAPVTLEARLAVEADPERVERPEEQAAPALVPVGPIELAADGSTATRPERLRRERERRGSGRSRSRSRSESGRRMKSRTTPAAQRLAPTPRPV